MFCSISCSNNAKIGIKKGNEIKIFNDFAKIIVNSNFKKFGIKEVLIDLDDIRISAEKKTSSTKRKENEYANSGIITISCTVTCCSSRNATRTSEGTKSN